MTKEEQAQNNNDLIEAAGNGDLPGVLNALAAGAEINYRRDHSLPEEFSTLDAFIICPAGDTALMHAAWYGHTDSVVALLENGANYQLRHDYDDLTALKKAQSRGHEKTVAAINAFIERKKLFEVISPSDQKDESAQLAM